MAKRMNAGAILLVTLLIGATMVRGQSSSTAGNQDDDDDGDDNEININFNGLSDPIGDNKTYIVWGGGCFLGLIIVCCCLWPFARDVRMCCCPPKQQIILLQMHPDSDLQPLLQQSQSGRV